MFFSHEYFMQQALREAELAQEEGEVPIGAVIVMENRIIARAHNLTEKLNDVTAHAEMQAITSAANFLGGKYLNECALYVTLEPCVMCAGTAYLAHLKTIVYGAPDNKRGFTTISKEIIHPKTELIGGILENKCSVLLKNFFREKREH